SGLLLRDAAQMLTAKFRLWPWAVYDGVPLANPHVVSDTDFDVSFQLGARTNISRAEYRRRIGAVGERLSEFLRDIPCDASLDDPSLDLASLRRAVIDICGCMTKLDGIKLANASKIIHRHRPAFLPILDSVVRDYYWFAISLRDEELYLRLSSMTWGEYSFVLMEKIRQDLLAISGQLAEVRRAEAVADYAGVSA